MQLLNRVIFVFFISITFFSCSKRSTGFFNNNYQRYEARDTKSLQLSSEDIQANASEELKTFDQLQSDNSNFQQFPVNSELNNKISEVTAQKGKLTKEERKAIKKDIKQTIKVSKNNESTLGTGILVLLAILLPPLAVALVDGISGPFWLSLLLTIIFYVPGLIYALYRIFRN